MRLVKLSAMVFVAVLLVPSIGGTHGGDAREEGAYHIAPKTAWDQPDAASMRVGDHEISRGEFLAYLQTVGENEIHADLLQRSFQLHFTLSQGIIRQHPQDADDLLKRIAAAETPSEEEAGQLKAWIAGQAELYAAIVASADKARAAGLDKTPEVRDVLDTFHRHLKADFLQDLVTYGTMEPTADAVRAYAAGLTPADKSGTAELFPDPDTLRPFERAKKEERWKKYFKAMRNATAFGRDYEKNQKLSKTAPETPIAHVGAEPIALSYFLNVYGPVPNDVNWNDIKKSRVRLLAEVFLLSSEYDRLGFARPDVEDEFTMLETFHLFAVQAARDLGGKVLGQPPDDSFVLLKQLCEFQNLPRVRNAFVDATAETAPWIDRELLDATEWVVEKHGD